MARIAQTASKGWMHLLPPIRLLHVLAAGLALGAAFLAPSILNLPFGSELAAAQRSKSAAASLDEDGEEKGKGGRSAGLQSIVVLVNDEPITGYQIEQRARLLALNANVSEQAKNNFQRLVKAESTNARFKALQEQVLRQNQGKSREQIIAIFQERQKEFATALQKQALESARSGMLPRLKKEAKEELIDERLKLQEARKLGIQVSDDDVKSMLGNLAQRNKMTYDQFAKHLKGMGVDISTMGERFRAQRAWRDLIGRRYGAQVNVSQLDVERELTSSTTDVSADTLELQVAKITLGLPGGNDQTGLAKRFADAEGLRRRFKDCKSVDDLAKSIPGAKVDPVRYIKPGSVEEPTRSMLLSAKDGDMLPPATTNSGVEIYAVCGRRTVVANEDQRTKAKEELQYKQLEMLAQRHMRNVRQDAHIEHR